MNARELLGGYDEFIAGREFEVPLFEKVKLTYLAGGASRNLRQCMFYIKKNRGTSYAALDKKGRAVRKLMGFLVDPIVCQQNNIDSNFTTALEELYELNKEHDRLKRRITELEAAISEAELRLESSK